MRTIRSNCFETNSSSTHSITLHAPGKIQEPTSTFLANKEGFIDVELDADPSPDSNLKDKLEFLLSFAYEVGDQDAFDTVKRVVEDFTKIPLRIKADVWNKDSRKWESFETTKVNPEAEENYLKFKKGDKKALDLTSDGFGSFINEDYGHSDFRDLYDEWNKIVASDDMIKTFIFSNHHAFTETEYYDG